MGVEAVFTNDVTEFRHALNLADQEIRSRRLSAGTRKRLLAYVEDVKTANVFLASFSFKRDLLSQWRAYCTPGPGFALGFRAASLPTGGALWCRLCKCEYSRRQQKAAIRELVDLAVGSPSAPVIPADHPLSGLDFPNILALIAPLIKHETFSAEKEWRLILSPLNGPHSLVFHRPGTSSIVPYVRLALALDGNPLPLTRVIIGPTREKQLASDAVFSLLRSTDAHIKIGHSRVPFRNW